MSMAKRDGFSIEWDGLDEFIDELEGMEKEFVANVEKGMAKYGMLAEEGSRALVHRDSGDLETSISFGKPKREGGNIVVEGGSNLAYALRRHEERVRRGYHDKYDAGVKYPRYYFNGRGERTQQKPTWRGEVPGRKFMERAIKVTETEFDKIMAEALEKTLGGKR